MFDKLRYKHYTMASIVIKCFRIFRFLEPQRYVIDIWYDYFIYGLEMIKYFINTLLEVYRENQFILIVS